VSCGQHDFQDADLVSEGDSRMKVEINLLSKRQTNGCRRILISNPQINTSKRGNSGLIEHNTDTSTFLTKSGEEFKLAHACFA